MLGAILPDDEDLVALEANKSWRVIYVYFPVALYVFLILSLLFIIRYDSIQFLVLEKRDEEAKKAIG